MAFILYPISELCMNKFLTVKQRLRRNCKKLKTKVGDRRVLSNNQLHMEVILIAFCVLGILWKTAGILVQRGVRQAERAEEDAIALARQ